ncbi:PREDICTED: uncharacterized protein LOC108370862 isoform X2 [Rhagoletis zephyria]|uniref:uncharacterized protein LOC108370862 isoform X2 n=1 Tax=Rhagoletis zephyria TaxID=28612 RepID=UPI000811858A|nr:PREDICTED: uncharacterized protein LOC108370862 isoform X2 [Rhagoletis zephyria]XP_036320372.1 uncharacterized protein LOC118734789 isoform X2 [Rhagoletis pomonella]
MQRFIFSSYIPDDIFGCIDGTHIGLQKPTQNEHMYFNRKGFHSPNDMIRMILLCGKTQIKGGLWKSDLNGIGMRICGYFVTLAIRSNRGALHLIEIHKMGQVSALLRTYIHSRARCIIERTIGILKGRWGILVNDKRGKYDPAKVARFGNGCSAQHCIMYV